MKVASVAEHALSLLSQFFVYAWNGPPKFGQNVNPDLSLGVSLGMTLPLTVGLALSFGSRKVFV